jgi:hypothetical protein
MPQFGTRVAKENNTTYTADTDGFVFAYGWSRDGLNLLGQMWIGNAIDPEIIIDTGLTVSITIPIRAGDRYNVTFYDAAGGSTQESAQRKVTPPSKMQSIPLIVKKIWWLPMVGE